MLCDSSYEDSSPIDHYIANSLFKVEVSKWLVNAYDLAAHFGHLRILQWLKRSFGMSLTAATCFHAPCPWDENTCGYVAKYGHLHVFIIIYKTFIYMCCSG